jgi:hypothetical protein
VAALATGMAAGETQAQTIAYRNLLQFDLQSFRSQATAGIFHDDVDLIGDATRLLEVDGTRVFTNFSNLSDPATIGDNLISYSWDRVSDFTAEGSLPGVGSGAPDTFDAGSYLGGWIGKYDQESEYTFSLIYQRSGHKAMFEDLEDGDLDGNNAGGTGTVDFNDAEFTGDLLTEVDGGTIDNGGTPDGDVDQTTQRLTDLVRYDDRSAAAFDLGAAREIAGTDWSVGGRLFWRSDKIERNAEGTNEIISRVKIADNGPLVETGRTLTSYSASMEDAFKMREAGVSLSADWHPGGWSLNSRLDVVGINMTNPSSGTSTPGLGSRGKSIDLPWMMSGNTPDIFQTTTSTVVTTPTGFNPNPLGNLNADQVNTSWFTGNFYLGDYFEEYYWYRGFSYATESVDDERTGIGFGAKLELDRPAWGGDSRVWAGVNYRPVDIDATILMATRAGNTFWWNDAVAGTGDVQATATTVDGTSTLEWSGDATNTVLEAGAKWWRALSNRVEMGAGIILTRGTWNQEYRETSTLNQVQFRFDDGFGTLGGNELETSGLPGTGVGTYNEEQTLITATTEADYQDETQETDVRLPVGAQLNITKKMKWQMGVQHKIAYWNREFNRTAPADTDGQVVTTFTDYANSANNVTTYSGAGQSSGTDTVTDKNEYNQTTYWYGLEWLIGETAQFNINGFFDSHAQPDDPSPSFTGGDTREIWDVDFFRNLAVSLTFLFD